jgi:hypothetical protein
MADPSRVVEHVLLHCAAPECKETVWVFLEPYPPEMWGWKLRTCTKAGCPVAGQKDYFCHKHRILSHHDCEK